MIKKYYFTNKKAVFKAGAVLSLAILIAMQTTGCGTAGKETNTTAADISAGEMKGDRQGRPDDDEKKAGTDSGIESGRDTADGDSGAASQAEGDAGIEAEPGMPVKAGVKAPDFTADLIDGTTISLSDYSGKPVIINFWATWCGPCVREMPAFERLKADYGDQIGIIAVNCGEDVDTVNDFVSENGYTFPVALDGDYQVSMLYPTNSIPYTVIVDAAGKVTHTSAGALDADAMYERYKEALGL